MSLTQCGPSRQMVFELVSRAGLSCFVFELVFSFSASLRWYAKENLFDSGLTMSICVFIRMQTNENYIGVAQAKLLKRFGTSYSDADSASEWELAYLYTQSLHFLTTFRSLDKFCGLYHLRCSLNCKRTFSPFCKSRPPAEILALFGAVKLGHDTTAKG